MTPVPLGKPFSLTKTLTPPPSSPISGVPASLSLTFLSSSVCFPLRASSAVARLFRALPSVVIHGHRGRTATVLHATSTANSEIAFLLREVGCDDEEIEALLQRHRPLARARPESLRHRLVSLQAAGISGFALPLSIAKRPEILTSEGMDPFLDCVRDELGGIDPPKLERLLTTADPQTLGGVPDRIRLLVNHGVPRDKLGHVVNGLHIKKVFCDRSAQRLEETLLLLEHIGGAAELVLRRPQLLNLDLESQLIPRIAFLTELAGGDEAAAGKLVRKLPFVLAYSVEHFQSHLEFWISIGLSREQVFKIMLGYPRVFSVSRERKLAPRIEFLSQCGLDTDAIFRFLVKAPVFLSLSSENLARKLAFLVKMGYRHGTRGTAVAVGAVTRTSCENLQGVVGVLLGYGFSVSDVLAMSRRHPQLLQYNCESVEEKLEYLVGEMEREVEELLAFPAFFGYKLDHRIKQRYEVKMGKGMSLNKLLSVSTESFYSNKCSSDLQSSD